MKNVLVIGSTGQIGSELTMKIRKMCPEATLLPVTLKALSLRVFCSKAALPPRRMYATASSFSES